MHPLQKAAGLLDANGKTLFNFHALRHFAAWLWIELGLSPKRLQALLGHISVQMTFDRYGHLFPSPEDEHECFARGRDRVGGLSPGPRRTPRKPRLSGRAFFATSLRPDPIVTAAEPQKS